MRGRPVSKPWVLVKELWRFHLGKRWTRLLEMERRKVFKIWWRRRGRSRLINGSRRRKWLVNGSGRWKWLVNGSGRRCFFLWGAWFIHNWRWSTNRRFLIWCWGFLIHWHWRKRFLIDWHRGRERVVIFRRVREFWVVFEEMPKEG